MSAKWYRVIFIVVTLLALFLVSYLSSNKTLSSDEPVNKELKDRIEEKDEDASVAASFVQLAESSRVQVIEDSISESIEESIQERRSIAESLNAEAQSAGAVAQSVSESVSVMQSSIEESAVLAGELEESHVQEQMESLASEMESAAVAYESAESEASVAIEELATIDEVTNQESYVATSGLTILVGDSRTSGFEVYGLWPAGQVFYMLDQVEMHYDLLNQAANQNPTNIIFSNGVDDMLCNGTQGAINQYEKYIARFHELSPNTRIFVQAVLPATGAGIERFPILNEIPTYNGMIADMCGRNGWTYIDCSAGFDPSYVGPDGIHFDANWTAMWLNNMRLTVGF